MPSHPELVAAFRGGLASGVLPPGLTAPIPEEGARRFAVYRNNVAHGLTEALGRRFPTVQRLVGEAFFQAMARVFLGAHPPASPVLLAWGEALPGFLERFPPVQGLPYLPDVARLELARGRAYHAADHDPVPPDVLAQAAQDPTGARLRLHPSVQVVASRFAVVSIWQANQPHRGPGAVTAGRAETALVLRDHAFDVPVHAISPGDAAFLEELGKGEALLSCAAAAARTDPRHDPRALLGRLAQAGAFIADSREGRP